MKKRIFCLMIALSLCACLFSLNVSAAPSGKCGKNVSWSINNNWEMTIYGKGDMADWQYSADVPWYNYRGSIRKVTVKEGVTSIAPYAFYCQEALTEIVLADSVTKIGENAFMNTRFMKKIDLGEGVAEIGKNAFHNSRSVKEIVIPDSVTTIEEGAFYDCDSVTEIVIPDSVTTVGASAFANCGSLTSVHIGSGVTHLGDRAFSACGSLTAIEAADNENFVTVDGVLFDKSGTVLLQYPCGKGGTYTVPEGVTEIADWAFAYSALTDVILPDSVTKIGSCAFYTSESLASVTLGAGVAEVGEFAFYQCRSLSGITLPESVSSVGDSAFQHCDLLSTAEILTKTASFGKNVFDPLLVTFTAYADSTAQAYAAANAIALTEMEVPAEIPVLGIIITAGILCVVAAAVAVVIIIKKHSGKKAKTITAGE